MLYTALSEKQKGETLNNTEHGRFLSVFLEGADGSGKTTLLKFLQSRFDLIVAPKSSSFGLMPTNQQERTDWFQKENPFVTSRIYLQSQLQRFKLYDSYFARSHYTLSQRSRFNAPPLIVWDRGPLTAKAFAYACLRTGTGLPDAWIRNYISLHFPDQQFPFSLSVIFKLADLNNDVDQLLQRLDPSENPKIERPLIEGQSIYLIEQNPANAICLNPLDDIKKIHQRVAEEISLRLAMKAKQNEQTIKDVGCPPNRLMLQTLLSRISHLHFSGEVTIIGGVVEKGYSDNDVDILTSSPVDLEQIKHACGDYAPFVHVKKYEQSDPKELGNPWKLNIGNSSVSF